MITFEFPNKKGCLSTSLFVSLVSIRQPEQPGHLASKAEQRLGLEQQQDSELAAQEPGVASVVASELVGSKQALEQGRAVGRASAVQQGRELGVAARVAELGVAAIAVQQGQGREQQPGAWVQPEQQTTGAWERWQQGNQRQPAHRLVR